MAGSAHPTIAVDVDGLPAELAAVDALARLQLRARRRGSCVRISGASADLRALIELVGLADVLGVEPVGQAEQREQPLGVEEERELDDPPV